MLSRQLLARQSALLIMSRGRKILLLENVAVHSYVRKRVRILRQFKAKEPMRSQDSFLEATRDARGLWIRMIAKKDIIHFGRNAGVPRTSDSTEEVLKKMSCFVSGKWYPLRLTRGYVREHDSSEDIISLLHGRAYGTSRLTARCLRSGSPL